MTLSFFDLQPDAPLACDLGLPDVYADAIATVECLGTTFRAVYFTWSRMPGSSVMTRIPVVRIVRPIDSLIGGCGISTLLDGGRSRH